MCQLHGKELKCCGSCTLFISEGRVQRKFQLYDDFSGQSMPEIESSDTISLVSPRAKRKFKVPGEKKVQKGRNKKRTNYLFIGIIA